MRRLPILLTVALVACSSQPSVEAFCEQAVPVLSRQDIGDDPTAMQDQIDDVSAAMDLLPDDQSAGLLSQLDALNEQLNLAVQGRAENGWSNSGVVEVVAQLCDSTDLISWTVQP